MTKRKRNMASIGGRRGWRRGRGRGLEMKEVRRLITIRTLTHQRPQGERRRCTVADGTALMGRRGRRREAEGRSHRGAGRRIRLDVCEGGSPLSRST